MKQLTCNQHGTEPGAARTCKILHETGAAMFQGWCGAGSLLEGQYCAQRTRQSSFGGLTARLAQAVIYAHIIAASVPGSALLEKAGVPIAAAGPSLPLPSRIPTPRCVQAADLRPLEGL
jgi:hypothetical protein